MKNNIIKSIQAFDSGINLDNIEYSNNVIKVKELISLYNLRLNVYNDKNITYKDIEFLKKKIHAFSELDKLKVSNIKMVNIYNYIFYFDEEFLKIYLVMDNLKKEVKNLW